MHGLIMAAVSTHCKSIETAREQRRMPAQQLCLTKRLLVLADGGLNHVQRGFFTQWGSVVCLEIFTRWLDQIGGDGCSGFYRCSQTQTLLC